MKKKACLYTEDLHIRLSEEQICFLSYLENKYGGSKASHVKKMITMIMIKEGFNLDEYKETN